ncbi:glycosyltransferase [Paenibacillus sinopodophylli]|uniref:glycosyltransferase n=1 Tax=Paenibacillus sinopodophylli TaxID=1837342 RepID=UPI00110CE1F6|nr:glycosyltransferase [Paenibacillus sinopodophylli]
MTIKVSVIIPVYNAEAYLAECIESLLNQTIQACEFIFINDGSADNSVSIIQKYGQQDTRIILVEQMNQGVSAARNAGLKVASGAYIGFVDADDYVEADMFERLYTAADRDGSEIMVSNFGTVIEGQYVMVKYSYPVDKRLDEAFIQAQVIPRFLEKDDLNAVWNKLYLRSLIQTNEITFSKQLALGEDGLFNMIAFSYAKSMTYIDYAGYHYRETPGSATRDIVRMDYFKRAIEVYYTDPPDRYKQLLDEQTIGELKAIKLMNNVMAYIHMYSKPTRNFPFNEQIKYIQRMIACDEVRMALRTYKGKIRAERNRYEKLFLHFIGIRSWLGLYCMTAYSRYRN